MRVLEIREKTLPVASPIRNAYIDAAGLAPGGNESDPDLFQPFGGLPDGVRVENGYVAMPDLVGIGFEGKSDLCRVMRELSA